MNTIQYNTPCVGFNANGISVDVDVTPLIISASRSTDIPAFYAEWLINRLNEGYCIWYNPFNKKPLRVSFAKTRAFVFWSKNPARLLPHLEEFDKKGLGYYFQFTLNDYVREKFEPNVGSLETRIETFRKLSARIGRERIIWRFDPIIMGPELSPADILERIRVIGNQLKGYTEKLVFSFVDIAAYQKVRINMAQTAPFTKQTVFTAEATEAQILEICEGLAALRDRWKKEGWELALATCAEKAELGKYGIEHNRCIDDVLLRRLYPHDSELMAYLGEKQGKKQRKKEVQYQLPIAGATSKPSLPLESNLRLKDKGQRKECGCIVSKDIGVYNTCAHFCAYCYANHRVAKVEENHRNHSPYNESITGGAPSQSA